MCLRHTRASLRGVEVLRESPKIPSKESALQVWLRPNPTIRDRFVPAAGMAERSLGGNWARTQQPHLSVVDTHTQDSRFVLCCGMQTSQTPNVQ